MTANSTLMTTPEASAHATMTMATRGTLRPRALADLDTTDDRDTKRACRLGIDRNSGRISMCRDDNGIVTRLSLLGLLASPIVDTDMHTRDSYQTEQDQRADAREQARAFANAMRRQSVRTPRFAAFLDVLESC